MQITVHGCKHTLTLCRTHTHDCGKTLNGNYYYTRDGVRYELVIVRGDLLIFF